jgi:hypothetical protein
LWRWLSNKRDELILASHAVRLFFATLMQFPFALQEKMQRSIFRKMEDGQCLTLLSINTGEQSKLYQVLIPGRDRRGNLCAGFVRAKGSEDIRKGEHLRDVVSQRVDLVSHAHLY